VDERAADVLTRKFYVTVGVNKQGEAQAFFDYDQRFAEARTQHWKSTGYTAGLQVVYVDFLTTVNFPAETPEYLRSLTGSTARLEECGVRVFGDESRAGVSKIYGELNAALSAPSHGEPVRVPEGWKWVPVEATTEMVSALKARISCTSRGGILNAGNALNDAIAAAPSAGSHKDEV
jgi:hypothetical protein